MSRFLKQLIFISLGIAIITIGGVIIYGAIPSGNLKIVGGYQQYGSGRPVAWWKMDEASWNGTANEVVDSIGANHGTAAGGATKANTTSTAVFGRAGSFDGADDYVQIADNNSLDLSGNGAIATWVKMTALPYPFTDYEILFKRNGSGTNYQFFIAGSQGSSHQNELGFYNGSSAFFSGWSININAWHHIALVRTGTNAMTFYVDGIAKNTVATDWGTYLASPLYIGGDGGTVGGYYTNGLIDDVRIYNYALTANQVKQIYNETAKIKMVKQENTTSTSNNPVGWWKMDEGTGQYAYDVSGNGNTGTLGTSTVADGADPTWTTGKLGNGLSFDGVNDYVSVADNANLRFDDTNPFTVSVWVKKGVNPITSYILVKGEYASAYKYNYKILALSNGGFAWTIADNSYNQQSFTSGAYSYNWHYLTMSFNGSNECKCYVDGVYVGSITVASVYSGAERLSFGAIWRTDTSVWTDYFNGLIDDVRIYNRALTAGEVAQMYNSTKDGYLGNIKVSTGLVGYWKLDDNNALTSVIDYSGKGNTGTAYSGTATTTSVLSTSTAMIGRAMSFDGVDDYVSVANNSSLNMGANNLTVSAWVKANVAPSPGWGGVYFRTSGIGEIGFGVYVNSKFLFSLYDTTTPSRLGIDVFSTGATIVDQQWHYWVGVRNGYNFYLYKDGVLNSSGTKANFGAIDTVAGGTAYMGSYNTTAGRFNGLVDEVKIWNYARSAEDIKNDYVRGTKGR